MLSKTRGCMKMVKFFLILSMACFPVLGSGFPTVHAENTADEWKLTDYGEKSQGSVSFEDNGIQLTTSSYNVWSLADECTFLSKNYGFPYDECSTLTVTATINSIEDATNFNAAAGPMIRDSDTAESQNVMWRVLPTGDTRFTYRNVKGGASANKSGPKLTFPVELKLVRQGDIFTAYYKMDGEWKIHAYVKVEMGTEVMAGIAGFSVETAPVTAHFSDVSIQSESNYVEPDGQYVDTEPVPENLLLRERFEDGTVTNGPASAINAVWEGVKYANIVKDAAGNYVWKRNRMMGTVMAGNQRWTDYEASADFRFEPGSTGKNLAQLLVRARSNVFYGDFYYAAGFTDSTKLVLTKTSCGSTTTIKTVTIDNYMDDQKRNLKVKVLDNTIEVYLDEVLKIQYKDENLPNLRGRIGIRTEETIVSLDNIIVTKLEDALGGDYDNSVGGNFDKPAPAYVQ